MRVCLIIEGAYPYIRGGMSNWIQQLICSMPEVEFVVQSIAVDRSTRREFVYEIPENCVEIEEIYLQDDDYVGSGIQKKIHLTDEEYEAFEGLIFGETVDWESLFQFFGKREVSLNALLTGKDFLSMTLNYYQKNFVSISFTDFLWSMRSMYMPLFSIMKSRPMEADLYHAASSGYAGILGSMQRALYHKPFLLSEHGFYTREREEEIIKASWVKGVYKDLWIQQFKKIGDCNYRYADRVTSLYEDGRRIQMEAGCPAAKTLVIPNGIDPERFRDVPQKDPSDSFINIGTLIRITPIKDVKTMIRAFGLAKEKRADLKLWIMGGSEEAPEYAEECRSLVKEMGIADVEFTGTIRPEDYIGKMDMLVLSSLSEGQPLSILEGFTARKPFISTNVGNCRGLIEGEHDTWGPAGIVVPLMGVTSLANAMLRLANDAQLRRQMGEVGRKRVKNFYNGTEIMERYRRVYGEMTGTSGEK